MGESVSVGIAGFIFYVLTILAVLRMKGRYGPSLTVILSAIACYGILLTLVIISGRKINFWALSASYWFFSLCFLMVLGAILKSISLRILLVLLEHRVPTKNYYTILGSCVLQESYKDRIKILTAANFATRDTSGFILTNKGSLIASIVNSIQQLFKIEKSG